MQRIIIICLLVLLGAGGYWFYKNPDKVEDFSDSVSEAVNPDFSSKHMLTAIEVKEKTAIVEIDVKYPKTPCPKCGFFCFHAI
jgi:hypothetical protein